MLNEFKAFLATGTVVDRAVGLIIGAAFTAIVNSMVADLINPIIGVITGGIDFSNLFIDLKALTHGEASQFTSLKAARDAGAPVFAYGSFITAVINFLIIAWVVFLLVKAVNKLKAATAKKEAEAAAAAPAGPTELAVLLEIRDALKK